MLTGTDIRSGIQTNDKIGPCGMLSHLSRLESESISIIREVIASFSKPVMLYSIGKDSAVMLHLALKACAPGKLPFPLLHVDTKWKFREMIEHRNKTTKKFSLDLIVHTNQEGIDQGITPLTHGSRIHTDVMKTQALKQALNLHGFDAAFGGARRDEEKSRAKERIFSFRSKTHQWNPKAQRPELWSIFNTRIDKGENVRVFPLSNWTELDIWNYIKQENIEVVPLYFAAKRKVVQRDGALIMLDDERLTVEPHEKASSKLVRFRTLGCYPLTSAIESDATDVDGIIHELQNTKMSERQGRSIDKDQIGSMEKKKIEGYF
jgi:sulfate adenylyltransferase subunit 2